ncbi:MAG: ComEC family competence protein [Hyphomonadaceae bacterium]|nr:ComEC family competence protein [Hyphomonadaceae bacterium]
MALQRERWVLWLPPALVAGAAAWLTAPRDPAWEPLAAAFAASLALLLVLSLWSVDSALFAFGRRMAMGAGALVAAAALGALAAQVRTVAVAQPAFAAAMAPTIVEGWVVATEAGDAGPRLRLLVHSIDGAASVPRFVRISVSDAGLLTPGRGARCRAVLRLPSGPIAPGGYDFARRAYFERMGATGFAYGRCRPLDLAQPASLMDRLRLQLAAVRSDLAAAIIAAAPGRGGAIAAALVTGDRSAIDQQTNEALQNSGLGHLLSVSGIHMGVVGGLVFALLLWSLSVVPPIALRWPVKKLAAVGALTALAVYLVISGASVPAIRAFVMAFVAFGAILLDRPAISMRGLALAAVLVTLMFPESVLEPGFQMSFAATMALVALFEVLKGAASGPALPTPGPLIGGMQAIWRNIGGVLLISLVAGLATDPFAIYHFQRFSLYALPANLIAAPIMSFLVAPMAVIAALLAPFGLADPALQLMASALDLIAAVGATFGERPEAVRALPRPPDAAFLLCVAALLWGCLWRGALRWGGAVLVSASIYLYATAPTPVMAFDAALRAVFMREHDDWSLVADRRRSAYARERLGAMLGLSPRNVERLAEPSSCNEASCTLALRDRLVILVRRQEAWEAPCAQGTIVISGDAAPPALERRCAPAVMIDAHDLATQGGGLVYLGGASLRIERARPAGMSRPWTPQTALAGDQA